MGWNSYIEKAFSTARIDYSNCECYMFKEPYEVEECA